MQPKSLVILGRQPALGLAELESLPGSDNVTPFGLGVALLSTAPPKVPFSHLGGSVKLARVITQLEGANWRDIEKHLVNSAPHHAEHLPAGKLKLGLSVYGFNLGSNEIGRTALSIKKALVKSGRSTRVVPNKDTALSSAQVKHNQLTGDLGWELLVVKDGPNVWLAQTVAVQDIDAYAARDQARPKRDAKVGMLPPKLAQIIVNLAGKHVVPKGYTLNKARPAHRAVLLDPFCGTGVVLQEALLMGYEVVGSDNESRMIEYSRANLEWLQLDSSKWQVEVGDATTYKWKQSIDLVASETYLGQPYSALPPADQLSKNIHYVNQLHEKFFKNIGEQIESGTRLCLAVPAWKTPGGFKHLPCLDHLTDMGYNRLSFVHAKNEDLIYFREGQIVARELVVIVRK